MLKMTVLEPWQINSAVNIKEPSGIFQRAEKTGQGGGEKGERTDGKEDRHFLPMLKTGLAAINIEEAKATAVSGMRDILKNMGKGSDIGKGKNVERKQEMNNGAQVSEEKIDERQVDRTEIPAGLQNAIFFTTTDNDVVQDRLVDVAHEDSGEKNDVVLQRLTKGIGTQGGILISFKTEAENGAPFSPDKDSGEGMLKGTPSDSGNGKVAVPESLLAALRGKGIDEKDISKILAVIKEGELKSVPLERQVGEATVEKDSGVGMLKGTPSDSGNGKVAVPESLLAVLREKGIGEKDISKILAVIKEGELKSVPLERQVGEATVEKDSGAGMLKGTPSDSNTEKGDGRGDSPSFSGKGKVAVPEPFTLAEAADLTVYGSDSRVIKSGDAKPVEGRLLVDQIVSQLPTEADKGFSRVRIALFPENLGGLDMDIIIRENKIHVVLMADRQDVRQLLQGHADQLRNALQNQGLQVDGIDFLLRDSSRGMDSGSGGSHLSWREDNSSAKGGEREHDVPASSAMLLSAAGQAGGTVEGGISLFV